MKTILVTGGAGFIGSNFVRYMLKNYEDITLVNLDLLTYAGNLDNLAGVSDDKRYTFVRGDIHDGALVEQLFEKYGFDTVVNFAAESHVDRSITNPDIFMTTNVMGTLTLLDTAKRHWKLDPDDKYSRDFREGVKYLQVSTDEVYGALGATGMFTETTPLAPNSPYSASKASADMLVRAYNKTYGMPVNITRCSNNYGPYQFPEKLIPLMINNSLNDKQLPVYGDGMQIRDWLYVEAPPLRLCLKRARPARCTTSAATTREPISRSSSSFSPTPARAKTLSYTSRIAPAMTAATRSITTRSRPSLAGARSILSRPVWPAPSSGTCTTESGWIRSSPVNT